MEKFGAIVLAGNAKRHKQLRRKKRRGLFHWLIRPALWLSSRQEIEKRLASKINRDDYIVGENKTLLYIHPDLISQKNLNFLKRVLYFAGKTGDRFYRKNKTSLLEYLSKEGKTPISMVISSLQACQDIDSSRILVIGPKKQIGRELDRTGLKGVIVIDQGDSMGENIILGKEHLMGTGYHSEYILVLGGDVPLISPGSISDFIRSTRSRGGKPDIFYGMGSRFEMREFIHAHGLDHMGKVGPNHPKKGNLNKFGIPFIDSIGVFRKEKEAIPLMIGNIFLYRTTSVDQKFVDKFYSLRKMIANPLTYPYLILNWFMPGYRAWRGRLSLPEGERLFNEKTGISLKVCAVNPEVALDMDSYSDMRRISALQFHREGIERDLELDFKKYMRMKKRLERKRHKSRKRSRSRDI